MRQKRQGFTLIELLVVLAIVGTIGALVAPNLWQTYQQSSERFVVIEYGSEIGALKRELMEKKSSRTIKENALVGNSAKLGLPGLSMGWMIVENSEILLLPTGVTSGGYIEFESPTGRSWTLTLQPLDGAMDIESR